MAELSKHIEMGIFELNVKNLSLMKDFYHKLVGLEIIEETNSTVTLGYKSTKIIKLNLNDSLRPSLKNEPGLYHSALVFSNQAHLSTVYNRIKQVFPISFAGSADHLVSEAFYFYDPEGNGLELYFDKDSETWVWKDGKVLMDTLNLNPTKYAYKHLYENFDREKIKVGLIKTGHIHLKVGSLEEAEKFYLDIIGFVKVSEIPKAIFISDGKYHHHLGINIRETKGSQKNEETLGLKSFQIILEKVEDLENLKSRLQKADISYIFENGTLEVTDPWKNILKFTVKN